jgi:hypothetical protein
MKKKVHIALVTTWYPPSTGVAVNRMHAFAKYLSDVDDFQLSIFTIGNKQFYIESESIDVYAVKPSFLSELLKNKSTDSKRIHQLKTLINIIYRKLIGSPYKLWHKNILTKIKKVNSLNPFSVIISSYAPEEAHLVVLNFLKLGNNTPWIADMRDEMSLNPGLSLRDRARLRIIEHEINMYAKAITTVSLPILEDFKQLCKGILNFEEVRNGYDHEIQNQPFRNEIFTMGFFGTFYGAIKPTILFKAIEQLKKQKPNFDFNIKLYGVHNNFDIPSPLIDNISIHRSMPYLDAIKQMSMMDALILLLPSQDRRGVYSGKIFDYLSVNRPIIACIDREDVAAKLLNTFNGNYISQFDDIVQVRDAVWNCYQDWLNNRIVPNSIDELKSLHRKFQVNKLETLIRSLL